MNTRTNAYQRKLSSGLVISLLTISAIVVLGSFAIPSHAANAQFSASLTYPYVVVNVAATRDLAISNPAGNSGITEIDLSISTSAAQAVASAANVDGFIGGIAGAVGGSGPWTIVYTGTAGAVILPQGAAGHLSFTFTPEASESSSGTVDTYTLTLFVTYKDGTTQTGTVTLTEGSATGVTTTLVTATPQTVGTSISFTAATNVADMGVPLTWTSTPSVSSVDNAGFSASFSPSSGATDASGSAASKFVATEAQSYTASAKLATPYGTDGPAGSELTPAASAAIVLNPGSPTQVKVGLTAYDAVGVGSDWASALTTPVTISLADQYGNAVATGVTGTVTFTALAGTISAATFTVTAGICAPNPCTTYTAQHAGADLNYGSFDLISAKLVVTAPAPLVGTYTGSSHQITVGYISTTAVAAAPVVTIYTTPYSGPGDVMAGTPVNVAYTFAGPEKGIPVNFSLIADPLTGYTGTFSNGKSWTVVTSSSTGIATANFTADTSAGDDTQVKAIVSEPTSANPTNTVASGLTAAITSGVAAPAGLLVQLYKSTGPLAGLTSYASPGKHLYVDVSLQDAYSNPVAWNNNFALGITLSASGGAGLSATSVAIFSGDEDTTDSGYTVQYTAPATIGDQTITATTTQTGVKSTTGTIHVVSLNPTVYITAPSGTLSANGQTVKGYAVPSKAAIAGTAVVSFQYSLNGATAVTTGVTGTNSSGASFFSFPVTFLNGTNTVKISATDSNSNVGTLTMTFTVTHAPPVGFAGSQVVQGTPTKATIGGYTGISATYKNTWTSAENEIVFAVWKNGAGQTVAVTTGGLNLAVGATGSAFMPLQAPLASGSYTVSIFVITTSNVPDSVSTPISVTV